MIEVECRRTMTSWSPATGEVLLFEAGKTYQAEPAGDGWSVRDQEGRGQFLGPEQFRTWFGEPSPPPSEAEPPAPEAAQEPGDEAAQSAEEAPESAEETAQPVEQLLAAYQAALAQAAQLGERFVRASLEAAVRTHALVFLSPVLTSITFQYGEQGSIVYLLLVDENGQELRLSTQGRSPFQAALGPAIQVAEELRLERLVW